MSLAALFASGYVAMSGPRVADPAQTTVIADCFGSGCDVTRECETGVTKSGCAFSNSGCIIQNPFDGTTLPFTGSAAVTFFQATAMKNPTNTKWNAGTTGDTTASGFNLFRGLLTATGHSVWHPSRPTSGATLSSITVAATDYIGVWAANPITSSTRQHCKATFRPIRSN